jgi:hypothetical protein
MKIFSQYFANKENPRYANKYRPSNDRDEMDDCRITVHVLRKPIVQDRPNPRQIDMTSMAVPCAGKGLSLHAARLSRAREPG